MKKQILFMMFLSLAFVFAGVKSYGQIKGGDLPYLGVSIDDIKCVEAGILECAAGDDGLSPIPGKEYTYTANDDGTVTEVASVQWFVYNATPTPSGFGPDIIDGGVLTTNAEPNNGSSQFLLDAHKVGDVTDTTVYNNIANKDVSIEISWQSFDAENNHILLVAYITGKDGCADNIEAYRIKPAFSFTVDLASLNDNGELDGEKCVSDVWSATYNSEEGDYGELNMDYGENYVYFVVNAANYVNSWQPKIGAEHSDGSVISEIAWAYPGEAIDEDFTDWNIINPTDSLGAIVEPSGGADAVGADGECIVVRVLVTHGEVENAIESTVTLSVEGYMYNADSKAYDLHHLEDGGDENECIDDQPDTADYILTPRPKITADDPEPFVPKDPVTP
jgi:hypothetical protein